MDVSSEATRIHQNADFDLEMCYLEFYGKYWGKFTRICRERQRKRR